MTNPIIQALEITGIGMGLVFLGILILWGMMALLVWIFKDKRTSEHEEEIHEEDQPASKPDLKKVAAVAAAVALSNKDLPRQAAASAVAVALSLASGAVQQLPATPMSSWQIANRMTQINLRNQFFTRKPRGN